VLISAATRRSGGSEESLFQLPRSDSFLRAFARMAYVADQMLRDLLADMGTPSAAPPIRRPPHRKGTLGRVRDCHADTRDG